MAKGANAKVQVINKIAQAFGSDYIGECDKKVYVWADDGGERVQIAITLTCPKNQINAEDATGASAPVGGALNFEDMPVARPVSKTEITQEEMDRVDELMKKLGL
jgi:hypothetical protein